MKWAAILFSFCLSAAFAQDTRAVREPVFPPACVSLSASLHSSGLDETHSDTSRIQQALDSCLPGHAVILKSQNGQDAFLSGPLQLRQGVTLTVDGGVVLFGSRNPRDYDVEPGSCGIVAQENTSGCKPLIGGDGVSDAAVMGPGIIDGRGEEKLIGSSSTWWELAEQARKGGHQQCPRILVLTHCNNFTLYRVTLKNSPNFHVYYNNGNGFTAWGVRIDTPKTARNTDGIDPAGSTNITITHCFIHTGDDHVAIKAGGQGHVSHVTIAHNHFYTGHGMSIGSETYGGAEAIRVSDLTIDGADNGIRIKSNSTRGGLVQNIVYQDVCIRNTKNPVFMDADYEHAGKSGAKLPVLRNIQLQNVEILGGGKLTLDGFDKNHRLEMNLRNVSFEREAKSQIVAEHADFQLANVDFVPSGADIHVDGKLGKTTHACSANSFPPMP